MLDAFVVIRGTTLKVLKDCVKAVGYTDVPSFLRKFKTLTGMTPTQYRQQQNEKNGT